MGFHHARFGIHFLILTMAVFAPPLLAAPPDVLDEPHNALVTQLAEDCEAIRMSLAAGWADALDARACAGYLRPWVQADPMPEVETIARRGVAMYERVKGIDDAITSTKFARDTRDADYPIEKEVAFYRNELRLAATEIARYVDDAHALSGKLRAQLIEQAKSKQISVKKIDPLPWPNPDRDAWRRAGAAAGIRVALDPHPLSNVAWWNKTLGLEAGYIARKFAKQGDAFVSPEWFVGAWGYNCVGPDQFDFSKLNQQVRAAKDRGLKFLLEMPTLQENRSPERVAQEEQSIKDSGWWAIDLWAPPVPAHLSGNVESQLVDQLGRAWGGVNLLHEQTAQQYAAYVAALSENLKKEGLYDSIVAVHLERGDVEGLSTQVDYSPQTRLRWQAFMKDRYAGDIARLNRDAGISAASFEELPVPPLVAPGKVAAEWALFTSFTTDRDPGRWGNHLMTKYGSPAEIREALGDDFRAGYGWRLPLSYAPVIAIDYLHFRRVWIDEYYQIKRKILAGAFPDKLLIAEQRQMGDHDEIAQTPEAKWGGLHADDFAVWSGTGPANDAQPFFVRSVGPPGFGTRLSDALESIFRDYTFLHFRDPGNMARYFYAWVSHGYLDYQLAWHSLTNHWQTNQLISALGPTITNTQPAKSRIGVVMPRATLDLGERSIYDGFLGWNWMLGNAKLPYTRVDEHRIRAGELATLGLEILILPDMRAIDARTAEEIRKWTNEGGILVASRMPGETDEYGRPLQTAPLLDVFGAVVAGTTQEPIEGTPLTRTISHGVWPDYRDPRPDYQILRPQGAQVIYSYLSAGPAVTSNNFGKGKAILFGYEFGRECVIADRTSVAFGRIYTTAWREPQLIERTKWLRDFFTQTLGHKPDFSVESAHIARWIDKDARAMSLSLPKGCSQTHGDFFYARTYGDPRGESHEVEIQDEAVDMGLRLFPRVRQGVSTRYLGISTREVHYIVPRGTVNLVLAPRVYRLRINDPKVAAIWDVARDVPVGFRKDDAGVSVEVSVPSGYVMMLAISTTNEVETFEADSFPGVSNESARGFATQFAGGQPAKPVENLTPGEIKPWLSGLTEKIVISYGQESNKPAATKLADAIRSTTRLECEIVEQAIAAVQTPNGDQTVTGVERPLIFIGDEWSNNDIAINSSHWNWGNHLGPHVPLTATYNWPGPGRAIVTLTRKHALINDAGRQVEGGVWSKATTIRPAEARFGIVRRKLYIYGNGQDAFHAVERIIEELN